MKHIRIGIVGKVIGVTVLLLALTGAGLRAQGKSPTTQILEQLSAIADTLNALVNSRPRPVVLSTSYLPFGGSGRACTVANVASISIVVRTRILDTVARVIAEDTTTVSPGHMASLSAGGNVSLSYARCEWTFEGFPDDVRASLLIGFESGGFISVPGQ
jgi:hypothetical protein